VAIETAYRLDIIGKASYNTELDGSLEEYSK